jgi:Trk K+ transport system NAD-binding subunit
MLAVGEAGLLTVAALIFVVRPIEVFACTFRSGLAWRERAFLAWLAPRGIVAAAIASLGAAALAERGQEGGEELRAMVFLTIAVTVVVLGGLGGLVARLLGVRAPARNSYILLGAEPVGLTLAEELRRRGRSVTLVDSNPDHCREAEEAGWPVVFGNALEERTLARSRPEQALAVVGLTANESVNHLFAREATARFGVPQAYVALERGSIGLPREMLDRHGIHVAFDGPRDLERWNVRFRHGLASLGRFRFGNEVVSEETPERESADPYLILAVERSDRIEPMRQDFEPKEGDFAIIAVLEERTNEALSALAAIGWTPHEPEESEQEPDSEGEARTERD